MGYVSENVFDEFVELYLTIDEAVYKALVAIRVLTEAHNAKIKREGETKAAAVKTKFPTHNVKLSVERDVTPDEALLKSKKFLKATTEATAIADSEAMATTEATAFADSEAKAAAVETKFPENNVKLNVECDVTPEAMMSDAKSPATGGSEVVMPDVE